MQRRLWTGLVWIALATGWEFSVAAAPAPIVEPVAAAAKPVVSSVGPIVPAARADAALASLQAHYWAWGSWRMNGYWQDAQALSAVIDAYARTRDPEWRKAIGQVYDANAGLGERGPYLTHYVDDEGWWALDWLRAYDLTGESRYLQTTQAIFADMAGTWDQTCGGGVWWNRDRTYKNAIPNELFLLLAMLLHDHTPPDAGKPALLGGSGPGSYLAWAQREADWFIASGMIGDDGLVNDGLDGACRNNGGTAWTYNQGVILAGLAELSAATGDERYARIAAIIAQAAIDRLTDARGVLYERGCEPGGDCGKDGPLFKGIFVRYLWWLEQRAPTPAYRAFLQTSLAALWQDDQNADGLFGLHWSGPPPSGDPQTQAEIAAVVALNAAATPLVPPSTP